MLISIGILCIILILPLLIIAKYNRPCADDYDYALLTHEAVENSQGGAKIMNVIKAAWQTDINYYNSWQGLYTSAFLLSLQPAIWGEKLYSLTTFIVLGICYLFLLGSVYILNKHFLKKSFLFCLVSSFTLLTILVLLLPSPNEGLYWYNGAMNYTPWFFASIFDACLLIEIGYSKNKIAKIILIIISSILAFIISGANHVTAFANILILSFATIYLLFKKRYYSLAPLIMALGGFGIMIVAPGTASRQGAFVKQTVITTILETIKHVYQLLGSWISLAWFLSLIIITPIVIQIAYLNKNKNISLKHLIGAILVMFLIICGMFCVPYYAMGSFGTGRLTNVVWMAFMVCSWIIYILIWEFLNKEKYVNINKFNSAKVKLGMNILSCLALIALFVLPINGQESNSLIAYHELRNKTAYYYGKQMDERIKLYNDKSLEEVKVNELNPKSKLLFFDDIKYSADDWPNVTVGQYYHKRIYKVPNLVD